MTSWLHEQRLAAVLDVVRANGVRTVLDLGCGDGDLLVQLAEDPQIERIIGIDQAFEALEGARRRLGKRHEIGTGARIDLRHASIAEANAIFTGFDCALLVETIEHIAPTRLLEIEQAVFQGMKPRFVVVTTPNAEFNSLLGVPAHRFRHPGHRFEWSRAEFQAWAAGVIGRNDYQVACSDIAGGHPRLGGASQMAVFERRQIEPTGEPEAC